MKIEDFLKKHENKEDFLLVKDFLIANYANKRSINFSYEEAKKKACNWIAEINFKNSQNLESGKVEVVKNFKDFKVVKLIDEASKKWEGFHMNNCLGSDLYKNSHDIYSLRDNQNIPHVSLEIRYNEAIQISGFGNQKVSHKYIDYILDFLEFSETSIQNIGMENLGYLKISKEIAESIKEHFSCQKIIERKGNIYLYTQNLLEIKKKFNSINYDVFMILSKYDQCTNAINDMIKIGIDLNKEINGKKAIVEAYKNKKRLLFEHLFVNGAYQDNSLGDLLCALIEEHNNSRLESLIEEGFVFDFSNKKAFKEACFSNNFEAIDIMIKNGFNLLSLTDEEILNLIRSNVSYIIFEKIFSKIDVKTLHIEDCLYFSRVDALKVMISKFKDQEKVKDLILKNDSVHSLFLIDFKIEDFTKRFAYKPNKCVESFSKNLNILELAVFAKNYRKFNPQFYSKSIDKIRKDKSKSTLKDKIKLWFILNF